MLEKGKLSLLDLLTFYKHVNEHVNEHVKKLVTDILFRLCGDFEEMSYRSYQIHWSWEVSFKSCIVSKTVLGTGDEN